MFSSGFVRYQTTGYEKLFCDRPIKSVGHRKAIKQKPRDPEEFYVLLSNRTTENSQKSTRNETIEMGISAKKLHNLTETKEHWRNLINVSGKRKAKWGERET